MIKRWNTLLIRLWKIGRNQKVNEMIKIKLKENIPKIKNILKQLDYDIIYRKIKGSPKNINFIMVTINIYKKLKIGKKC